MFEAYLDILMSVILELHLTDWSSPFTSAKYSIAISIILLAVCTIFTIATPIYLAFKRESWSKPDVKAKMGSLLSDYDARKGNEWPIVAMISLFMLRRLTFVILVLFMSKAQPIQVALV